MTPLFSHKPISLMISSRCEDQISFEGRNQPLDIIRRRVKERIEALTLDGTRDL